MDTPLETETAVYTAAHTQAIITDRSDLGMLKISGQTRLDLIHRMSTQAVNGLQSGQGTATVLTNDIGRIIDRLILYSSSDTVYALTSKNNSDNIARYLMRFVFFNDDFHIQDVSAETAVFGVYGARATERLIEAGFPAEPLPLHHWRQVKIGDITAYQHRTDPVAGDGYFIMCQQPERDALWNHLTEQGLLAANETAFETLRIESGQPRFHHELSGDFIPLETGLWEDVSFNKGCYIGQEIIARMESRGRLAKKLVQLRASQPFAVGELMADGKKAGVVTSTAVLPSGEWVGLGYVKTAVLDASLQLMVDETAVAAVEFKERVQ